jgi:hypothetical protein
VSVRQVVQAIEEVAPEVKGHISFTETLLPFPEELDDHALKALLPDAPETPLVEGVRATVDAFRDLVARRRIDIENAIS